MWAAEAIITENCPCEYYDRWDGEKKMVVVEKGTKVTITNGKNEKYAMWGPGAIYDMPEGWIDESTIKVLSKD